jgi:phenylacetate-CoA ligase
MTAHIKDTVGIQTRVKAVGPETLERSLGKAKRVFDKRAQE